MEINIIKVLFLSTLAFLAAFSLTPILTHFLYKNKLGKRIRNNGETPIFSQLHAHKDGTPTMGGILIWGTLLIMIFGFALLDDLLPGEWWSHFNFLSRSETLLPLGTLIITAFIGLFDDWLDVRGRGVLGGGGLKVWHRLIIYTLIATAGALWFYYKLDWSVFHVPFFGNLEIGAWYIPVFIFIIVATSFSVNESDGLDGLAGGTLLIAFAAYGVIAFSLGRYDLAVFCGVIIGSLLAFLWFNIPPARFYMGDTGAMSLGVTLGVIAMLTNYSPLLVLIGLVFVIESLSVILQLLSKKFLKKKLILSSPIHNHYQALGWPEAKVVMRFWVISGVGAASGLIIFMMDRNF